MHRCMSLYFHMFRHFDLFLSICLCQPSEAWCNVTAWPQYAYKMNISGIFLFNDGRRHYGVGNQAMPWGNSRQSSGCNKISLERKPLWAGLELKAAALERDSWVPVLSQRANQLRHGSQLCPSSNASVHFWVTHYGIVIRLTYLTPIRFLSVMSTNNPRVLTKL